MRIEYLKSNDRWEGNLLCVTHSDRPTEPAYCALNYLEKRYDIPERLPARVAFESLPHVSTQQPYKGTITVWQFRGQNYLQQPELLALLRPEDYKPQHAMWYQNKLWVLGVDRLEVYDSCISRLAVLEDPWLSGAHTIIPDGRGRLLLTCSGSDSVLVLNEKSLAVEAACRMPEAIYGRNFDLTRQDSVVEHYVPNDLQLTHINCASSWHGGIVVSMLIQGAIGWFDTARNYHELLRGFVGCHGVRADARTGNLYFSDSCLGVVVFLDNKLGIARRVDMASRWLHDALQIDGDTFAVSVTDANRVQLVDVSSRDIMTEISGAEFGMGTQFLSYGC